jgi:GPH family glycoside/pentoside/hexuronide:cation symporter
MRLESMRPRLRWRTKLGYGSAELGIVSVEVLIELYLLKFYNVTVGLAPHLTAMALAVAIVWDAVSDPIMGELSDRTRHPEGRRRPYIMPGAAALAASFILIYNPPAVDSTSFKFAFLMVSYLCLTTAMTVISVPHIALAGELSFDRDERTQIFGYRRLFTTMGLIVGTILPAMVIRWLGDESTAASVAKSRSLSSFLLAGPLLLTAWITFRSTRGLDRSQPDSTPRQPFRLGNLMRSQWKVVRSGVFFPILAVFIITGVGRTLNASTALYYYDYRLGIRESDTVLRVFIPFFVCILLSIPGWVWLARRWGKRWPAFVGVAGGGLIIAISYAFLPPGSLNGAMVASMAAGFFGGSLILLESLVTDVVDYDELRTGRQREGLYFGVWKMGNKLSRAVGLVLAGVLLSLIGFDETAAMQSAQVSWRLALLFGPAVGGFLLVGSFVLAFAPLTDARHRRVQALLLRRRTQRFARQQK